MGVGPAHATAVIAAAGSGERLGAGGPKAFVPLAGRPLLAWSVRAALAAETVGAIVITAPPGREAECWRVAAAEGPSAEITVLAGGLTRADSVRAALAAVSTGIVLVHDAARPLVEPDLFDAVARRLANEAGADAVIAAAPIVDTVKRAGTRRADIDAAGPPIVAGTEDRELLWVAQTPQAFRAERLREVQHRAEADGSLAAATDEAALIEGAGGRVLLEPAPAQNFKVTTGTDLRAAEALLAARDRV